MPEDNVYFVRIRKAENNGVQDVQVNRLVRNDQLFRIIGRISAYVDVGISHIKLVAVVHQEFGSVWVIFGNLQKDKANVVFVLVCQNVETFLLSVVDNGLYLLDLVFLIDVNLHL